jgi:hypothetical protein
MTMTNETTIFPPRAEERTKIAPTQEALDAFLETPAKDNARKPHGYDLARYRFLLSEISDFERRSPTARSEMNLGDLALYGSLSRSKFFNRELLNAAARYKYHLLQLLAVDFKTPLAFIQNAEREIGRLNKKKLDDVFRMKRLHEMIVERNEIIKKLAGPWSEQAAELIAVAKYIRENLPGVIALCERAGAVIGDASVAKKQRSLLAEELKFYIKDRTKQSLHDGKLNKDILEKAKKDYDALTDECATLVNEDAAVVKSVYDAVRNHAIKAETELRDLVAAIEQCGLADHLETNRLMQSAGRVITTLIADFRFEAHLPHQRSDEPHGTVIMAKRRERLLDLLDESGADRRNASDRRTSVDRRKPGPSNYTGEERRKGNERRIGNGRRARKGQ